MVVRLAVIKRYWYCRLVLLSGALLAALVIHPTNAQTAAQSVQPGGTYQYGHISWRSDGNTVEFTLEAVFKRSNPTDYYFGTAPDGFAQVGDIITLTGREHPRFYFGDDGMLNILKLQVTAYSTMEDWVMGETKLKHTYATPNDGGRPWIASFRGCCRLASLQNNNDAEWVIAAEVDLIQATESPRARILPVVSVPMRPASGGLPRIFLPAADSSNRNAVEWSLAKPWDVGNAAYFSRAKQSFLSVPLQPDFRGDASVPGFSETVTMSACTADPLNPNSVGPGCLFRLLRTDKDLKALTVEGWVKITAPADGGPAGGTVLSIGQDSMRAGTLTPECLTANPSDRNYVNICMISTLYVRVNETHVVAGHDLDQAGTTANGFRMAVAQEVAFRICSHPTVCADTGGSLLDKWVHIAVQRYQRGSVPSTDGVNNRWFHTYRVLVNGYILEIPQFPGGTRIATEIDYDPGESSKVEGPRAARTLPATTCRSCNPLSDWDCGCMERFARGTALIFGAYKGASSPASYFEGVLDEWRFWNGYRMVNEIVGNMNRKLRPQQNDAYGNPADPSFVVTQDKSTSRVSSLMALWNFDAVNAAPTTCSMSGLSGCDLADVLPVFPETGDSRLTMPGIALYRAYGKDVVTAPTDNTGVVFYSDGGIMSMGIGNLTINVAKPGMYQVLALLAMPGGRAKVPVDFIVSVVDAAYRSESAAYGLCRANAGVACAYESNLFMPTLRILGKVERVAACSGRIITGDDAQVSDLEDMLFPCSVTVMAGFNAWFQLEGVDAQPNMFDNSQAMDWRDTNVGFGFGPVPPTARFSAIHGTNPAKMDFTWTPCQQDLGMKTVCFEAVDNHVNRTSGATMPKASSEMKCLQIKVVADPPPRFEVGKDKTPTGLVQFTIGRQGSFGLFAVDDNCLDTVHIRGAVDANGVASMPSGALLKDVSASSSNLCSKTQALFTWMPSGKHGGFNQSVCFDAVDAGGSCTSMAPQVTTLCVRVAVFRCVYALQMDEQLQDIAARFGMDWMRLWSLNPNLRHPDYIVNIGQDILIGHLYRLDSRREMAGDIARRMGMSVQQLQDLNFDMDASQPLRQGQMLCVVPDSCKGMAKTAYGDIPYKDDSMLAAGADRIPLPAALWNGE